MNLKDILKRAKITGVKSYSVLYGTNENIFAKVHKGCPDSAWYCRINPNDSITINEKYFNYPKSIIEYNESLI